MADIKWTPEEIEDGLIDGEKYWLGATWGIYDKASNTFIMGNCFVPKSKTIFKNIDSN